MSGSDFVHISRVRPHPVNIRDDLGDLTELADSIRAHGILQPLIVEPHVMRRGEYIILAGHRRLAAAKLAGLEKVPITIRLTAGPDKAIEIMLVENCVRADLNAMERAEAMGKLRARGYTLARIAKATGLTEGSVSHSVALLDLDKSTQQRIRRGELTATDAYTALREHRVRARRVNGMKPIGSPKWEPDHFATSHPLAKQARTTCDGLGHSMRRRVGKVACGQCWETVIRADERVVGDTLHAVPDGRGAA